MEGRFSCGERRGSLRGYSIRKKQVMSPRFLGLALVLGLLSAIGPFAIDMYLPALPLIGQDLGASTSAVQFSLLAFFLSMGTAQLLVGPLSDMYGRKAPLYFSLVLFALGGVGSAFAPTIEWPAHSKSGSRRKPVRKMSPPL